MSSENSLQNFPVQFSFFFLLLVSFFYALRPLQIVLVTSSCGAGRRDIRMFGGERVWGIAPVFLHVQIFLTKGNFNETTTYAKWGVESLKAPSGGILHISPVHTAGRVKRQYRCPWLVCSSGVILLLSAEPSLKWSYCFIYLLCFTRYSPVEYVMSNSMQHSSNCEAWSCYEGSSS